MGWAGVRAGAVDGCQLGDKQLSAVMFGTTVFFNFISYLEEGNC